MEKTRLKTINIKGKEYTTVDARIVYFRENYPDYSLVTEIVEITPEFAILKAIIMNPEGKVMATGMALEEKASSYINKTSFLENCETSAWGRALANFGIGIDGVGIASASEVLNAINNQGRR